MEKILSAMSDFGLLLNDSLIIDGNIHRCHSSIKKKKNKDGWYIVYQKGDHYYSVFGCWIRGEHRKFSTNSDSKIDEKIWREIEEKRVAKEIERYKTAKSKAKKIISSTKSINVAEHYYLLNKGVGVYGNMKILKKTLLLPIINKYGEYVSYQTINEAGKKFFMPGGIVKGSCYPINGDDSIICICEGYATGASIHEATGYKVIVAFNAGNMYPVAQTAIGIFPGKNILICADNDYKVESSKGINTGIKAAKRIYEDFGLNYVFPTGIIGTDFNDLFAEKGIDAVRQAINGRQTIECLSEKDCIDHDDGLIIPPDLKINGLIAQGLDALDGDILQYSLPLVLTVISRAIAGKISVNHIHPNVFNIKVGGTSTGKTFTDKRFLQYLNMPDFVSMNDVASGPGIWRAVSENPCGMGLFDEVSSLFTRMNTKGGIDTIAEGKNHALLDLYSRSGQTFKKAFGDSKNSIQIDYPCVSIIGNATPTIFDSIKLQDFETGLLQRFDFWVYDGEIRKKPFSIGNEYNHKISSWVSELKKIMEVQKEQKQTIANIIMNVVNLDVTSNALIEIDLHSDKVIGEANTHDNEGLKGFISRKFDLALKYALIYHASAKGADNLYAPIDFDDVEWGIKIANILCDWKIKKLYDKVVSGDFHRDCEIFKKAIYSAIKQGRRPTFKYIATRRTALKNWEPKHSEKIISVLSKRGEIIVKESYGSTQYYLPK